MHTTHNWTEATPPPLGPEAGAPRYPGNELFFFFFFVYYLVLQQPWKSIHCRFSHLQIYTCSDTVTSAYPWTYLQLTPDPVKHHPHPPLCLVRAHQLDHQRQLIQLEQ